MPTGEQPAAQLTEKSTTDLRTVVLIVGVALSVAGIGAIARAAGEDAGTAIVQNKEQDKAITALQVSDAENRAEHKAIRDLLQEIRADLKEVKADVKKK